MAGSNILELRIARKWNDPSQTVKNDEKVQFRTKDVVISILGVSLGAWSDWQDLEGVEVVDIVG